MFDSIRRQYAKNRSAFQELVIDPAFDPSEVSRDIKEECFPLVALLKMCRQQYRCTLPESDSLYSPRELPAAP